MGLRESWWLSSLAVARTARQRLTNSGRTELAQRPAGERDAGLGLDVASRLVASEQATEFGAFQQAWTDSVGIRRTEFGRYVTYFLRQNDGSWKIDRFLGFEDSTRKVPRDL